MDPLDGNAAAGPLAALFGRDLTVAQATCGGCGSTHPVGAATVYEAAGTVIRCPGCGTVLMTIIETSTRLVVGFPGMRHLALATG